MGKEQLAILLDINILYWTGIEWGIIVPPSVMRAPKDFAPSKEVGVIEQLIELKNPQIQFLVSEKQVENHLCRNKIHPGEVDKIKGRFKGKLKYKLWIEFPGFRDDVQYFIDSVMGSNQVQDDIEVLFTALFHHGRKMKLGETFYVLTLDTRFKNRFVNREIQNRVKKDKKLCQLCVKYRLDFSRIKVCYPSQLLDDLKV